MQLQKVYAMPFSKVYPLYLAKAEKKGRSKEEVDQIIFWLTGYEEASLKQKIQEEADLETFFRDAPRFHPNAALIKGSICGCRVEEIQEETMWKIRCLDKLIDELAKGRPMEKILRT